MDMDKDTLLEAATEALKAHGDTKAIEEWYKKWMPKHYEEHGLETTVQYSLSCIFVEHVTDFLTRYNYG